MNDLSKPHEIVPTRGLDEAARDLRRTLPKLLRQHLDNWRKLKSNDGFPTIADLFSESDPLTQPWLVVIDTERSDVQKIRLVGTGIADFFGFDATGYDFLQTVLPDLREIFVEAHYRLSSELIGKFHLAICSTSTGRELEVYALALPYRRKDAAPCVAWILVPGDNLQYGETGSQVRSIIAQYWVTVSPE